MRTILDPLLQLNKIISICLPNALCLGLRELLHLAQLLAPAHSDLVRVGLLKLQALSPASHEWAVLGHRSLDMLHVAC